VVTLDPTATPVGGQGVGFHFVPSTAAQVTIKNGITLGSAAVTFDAPASNQTISNVLRGGISTTATVGHNNFVASFPGDLRIAAPATDSPNVTASTFFFNPQPSNTSPNAVMTPSPQVTVTGVTNALVSLSLDHGSFSAGTTSGTPDNFNNVTYGGLKIATAGTYFMLAMTGNDLIKSNSFNITGGLATQLKFTVGLPANTPAGQVQQVTVQAQDAGGNPANNYTGTVSFSYFGTADPQGTLPNNYTFVSGDNSTKQFNITLKTAGSRSVKVTDIANSSFTDTTSTTVVAGNTSQVTLNSPAAVTIGQAFANLVAHVQDGFGNPISGATVTFASTAGGTGSNGTFTGSAAAVTNSSGDATKVITANTSAGTFTVTATANSITSTASTLTINQGAASKLAVQQGSNQSTIVNSQFGTQFQVLATDSGNNPVPGFSVTFTSPSTGASCGYPSPTTTSVNTDNSGLATVTCTANSITGNYSVTAGGTGVTTVTITNLTNNVGAATNINIQAGNNQSATVNTNFATNLQVKVVDGSNNPIPGLFIQFTAPASGPSGTFGGVTSTTVGPTASDGTISATTFKANTTAGSYQVTATIGSVPGTNVFTDAVSRNRGRVRVNAATGNPQGVALVVSATFNLTNLAGAATTLTKVAGDNQGTTIGTAFGTNLKVNVTDAFSNPVSGASVTFTPPSSGASGTFASFSTVTSDASGNATAPAFTANNTVGGYNVSASASGTNTVTFALTNNAGAPAIMTIVGGNGQHATVTTAFATALQVKVTDAGQNPLTGISVTFTPPSSGASGTLGGSATVTTNSSGIATAPAYTANTIAGGNGLKAVAGSLNQTFNLTNDPGVPVSITPNGTPQTAVINASFGTLSVKVSDSFGNGVSGQSVTFTAPASGVGGAFAGNSKTFTGSTDSSGNLNASTFTANASTGTFTVTVASGALTPAIFTLTNIIVPTAGITVFTGSPQSTQPNTQFQQALVARVFDSQGNPVTTATVTFALPSSGPSGTFVGGGTTYTTTTNQQGLAFSPLINANGLQGTLSATASTGGFSTTFTLFISLPPAITAAPQVLIFQWEIGTALPKPQGVFVAAPNNQFTFAVDVPWAKVIATPHGTINDSLSVSVDPSNMPPGHYSGTLILSDGGAIVRLDLQVMPKPQINPSAKTISFTYTIGDGIPSEVQDNITAMTRNFNINVTTVYVTQTSVKWLKIVGDGTSTTPALLRVSIVPAGLDVGTYSAKIHIEAADATNSPYDITVTLTVQAAPVNPTPPEIVGLVNSATSQVGPISANEVVSMFGNNLGCVDGPQVLINGNDARILMSTYNQVNFIPPYVPANGKVSVQFLCRGVASNFISVDLAARVPGIYARQDGLLGDGPMAPGSPLVFHGTGFNGDIQPVVTIGGVRAEILYSGPASDLPGVTQINVRIPADAPGGSVLPIVVTQDGVPAQSGLSVATI
jgi:hypothetical protein